MLDSYAAGGRDQRIKSELIHGFPLTREPKHYLIPFLQTLTDEQLAYVTVKVDGGVVESVITRRSAEELKLKKGDSVTAVVKATEVMIAKP